MSLDDQTPPRRGLPRRGPAALLRLGADPFADVARALDLSQGLADLRPGTPVMIKPNLVGLPHEGEAPPYGVVATTLITEGLVQALRDAGAGPITIAEGSVVSQDLGMDTPSTMAQVGLPALARRYDLELLDLNAAEKQAVDLGEGLTIQVARPALEAEFFISLPVLKTHNQCRVSLALKNLKGCLRQRSKSACHDAGLNLDLNVARLARVLYPDLALVDGRYALALGPLHTGRAHRADLLIAARDALDADLVGAAVLGAAPEQVAHLAETARLLGRGCDLPQVKGGAGIDQVRLDLPWDWEWADQYTPEAYARHGVKGFILPKYDASLCTGCSFLYNPALVMVLAAGRGKDLGGVELLTGKAARPSGQASRTVVLGSCLHKELRKAPGMEEAVWIKGCPPTLADLAQGLRRAGIPAELADYHGYIAGLPRHYTPERGFLASDFAPSEKA